MVEESDHMTTSPKPKRVRAWLCLWSGGGRTMSLIDCSRHDSTAVTIIPGTFVPDAPKKRKKK
jgi:hypothetical protein